MTLKADALSEKILHNSAVGLKTHGFDDAHNPTQPAQWWFQHSNEGLVLFLVFYTQACQWSRCLGCNLPSKMSPRHVDFAAIMKQVDWVFSRPEIMAMSDRVAKVIISNNGSVLDEKTFSTTALVYLMAKINLHLTRVSALSLETRPEYVDWEELEILKRVAAEGETETRLELAIGFEAFDEEIRNAIFKKGLDLSKFEEKVAEIAKHGFGLKCYLMQKPVPGLNDEASTADVQRAIEYFISLQKKFNIRINVHLNPTYVAKGTQLEKSFRAGQFSPPHLRDVAKAVLAAEGSALTIYIGLNDEGLAVEGGSFLRPGEEKMAELMERFNRLQNFELIREALAF